MTDKQRNFRFSKQKMWRNVKFCQIWRNFKNLHMTDMTNSEVDPVFCCKICCKFVAIYALLRGEKLSQKLARWRKITNIRYAHGSGSHQICQSQEPWSSVPDYNLLPFMTSFKGISSRKWIYSRQCHGKWIGSYGPRLLYFCILTDIPTGLKKAPCKGGGCSNRILVNSQPPLKLTDAKWELFLSNSQAIFTKVDNDNFQQFSFGFHNRE